MPCITRLSMKTGKTIHRIQYTKNNRSKKNDDSDGKAFYKLMKNAVYNKTMEKLRNRVSVRLANNKKDYLKWTLKPSYV